MSVKNAWLIQFPTHTDSRGSLSVCEGENLPFQIRRTFWIYNTPGDSVRGGHAHKQSWQLHLCFNGSVKINLDDGENREIVVLDDPSVGLVVGPMVWHPFVIEKCALLQVFSSNEYSQDDYIHSYDEFVKATKS